MALALGFSRHENLFTYGGFPHAAKIAVNVQLRIPEQQQKKKKKSLSRFVDSIKSVAEAFASSVISEAPTASTETPSVDDTISLPEICEDTTEAAQSSSVDVSSAPLTFSEVTSKVAEAPTVNNTTTLPETCEGTTEAVQSSSVDMSLAPLTISEVIPTAVEIEEEFTSSVELFKLPSEFNFDFSSPESFTPSIFDSGTNSSETSSHSSRSGSLSGISVNQSPITSLSASPKTSNCFSFSDTCSDSEAKASPFDFSFTSNKQIVVPTPNKELHSTRCQNIFATTEVAMTCTKEVQLPSPNFTFTISNTDTSAEVVKAGSKEGRPSSNIFTFINSNSDTFTEVVKAGPTEFTSPLNDFTFITPNNDIATRRIITPKSIMITTNMSVQAEKPQYSTEDRGDQHDQGRSLEMNFDITSTTFTDGAAEADHLKTIIAAKHTLVENPEKPAKAKAEAKSVKVTVMSDEKNTKDTDENMDEAKKNNSKYTADELARWIEDGAPLKEKKSKKKKKKAKKGKKEAGEKAPVDA